MTRGYAAVLVLFGAVASSGCDFSTPAAVAPGGDNGGSPGGGGGGVGGGGASDDGGAGGGGGGGQSVACTGKQKQPLDATWTISAGGMDRTFDVHVPTSYDPTKATAVVLNFHGLTSNSMQEEFLAHTNEKGDEAGFIAVHPQGTGNPASWNAGACCDPAAMSMVDDVGFVKAMLDKLETDLCVDEKRIYSTGMSNGGFMSHRLACELADRIAAVAPVAGVMGLMTCNPSRPISVMHFHGTADPLVPYQGSPQMGFPGVEAMFNDWAKRDGCTAAPIESFRKGDSHCSSYKGCPGDNEVILCTVDNGGHTWPGGTPIPGLGNTTMDISATDAMWDFFLRHPLP
jgi:polyhydroxybutyrate depolymerase